MMQEKGLKESSGDLMAALRLASLESRSKVGISVVIPSYQRESVLLDTIDYLLRLDPGADEILIVDQTREHLPGTVDALRKLTNDERIRWLELPEPSITHAMNLGLTEAHNDVVLFLDDDVIPDANLLVAHASAQAQGGCSIVAGQVLQPGKEPMSEDGGETAFRFCSSRRQYVSELMGGNFSIKRDVALKLGGFDENFVHVAYRFEAEFAARALAAGEKILFEPEASIRHLKASTGGTRAYGNHLTTIKPSHSVGEYYYLLRSKEIPRRLLKIVARPLRAILTRHHLSHPWWIPGTLIAEAWGLLWALTLAMKGPRLVREQRSEVRSQRSDADF